MHLIQIPRYLPKYAYNLGYQLIEAGTGEVEETLKQEPWNPSIVAAEVNYDLNSLIF